MQMVFLEGQHVSSKWLLLEEVLMLVVGQSVTVVQTKISQHRMETL